MSDRSTSASVACIVLGAGAGKRYGGPKADARLPDGTRFVDRIAAVASEAGAGLIITVLPPGIGRPLGTTVVRGDPDAEQIASLRLGLAQLANTPVTGVLVWPVDHPHVARETVVAVIDAFGGTRAPIVIPTFGGRRGHPSIFARETWRELMTVERDGARGVIHAYEARVVEVDVSDDAVLRNMNTTSD